MRPESMDKFSYPGGKNGWWKSGEAKALLVADRVVGWQPEFGQLGQEYMN